MALRRKAQQKKEVNLTELIQSGDAGAYEALQLYRSRALRQKAKSDVTNALQTAAEGSTLLLRNGYKSAGCELAMLMVDFLNGLLWCLPSEERINGEHIGDEIQKAVAVSKKSMEGGK